MLRPPPSPTHFPYTTLFRSAGAIQDHKRGKIVGQKTRGMGTILRKYQLSDGGALWLAVYEWLTPNERRIWRKGIAPDKGRSEEHTSELQSLRHLVCRLLLEE